MHPQLIPITAADKPLLQQLMQLYLYDFSEYDDEDVNAHGYYTYNYLDCYWTEEGRHAFLIKVEGQIADFVLLARFCFVLKEEDRLSIAEFFIMRKYRRKGIGKKVAQEVLEKFPVHWEIMQYINNKPSLFFWEEVVKTFMGGMEKVNIQPIEDGTKQVMIFRRASLGNS